jgi:hypothetical protein
LRLYLAIAPFARRHDRRRPPDLAERGDRPRRDHAHGAFHDRCKRMSRGRARHMWRMISAPTSRSFGAKPMCNQAPAILVSLTALAFDHPPARAPLHPRTGSRKPRCSPSVEPIDHPSWHNPRSEGRRTRRRPCAVPLRARVSIIDQDFPKISSSPHRRPAIRFRAARRC